MGIPLMIQEKDNQRIKRIKRWKRAAKLAAKSSHSINKAFQTIPKEVREALHLLPGEKLHVFRYQNRLEFVPVKDIKKMRGFLKGIDTVIERADFEGLPQVKYITKK